MKLDLSASLLGFLTLLAIGCDTEDPSAALATRLESATAIQEVARKDLNLRTIALDAAGANNSDICKKAIQTITTAAMSDDTAAECLKTFRNAKNNKAAVEMAKLIRDQARRDMWLSDLSK